MDANVRTAFSIAEALNIGARIPQRSTPGPGGDDGIERARALFLTLEALANSLWTLAGPARSNSAIAQDVLARTQVSVLADALDPAVNGGEIRVALVSRGVTTGLRERLDAWLDAGDGIRSERIDSELLALVAYEGVLDWALRCTANPRFEIRRCFACSEWFLPLRLRRSRFCSSRCRNAFHFLKDAATFACDVCARTVPVAQWSGLSDNPSSGDLRISDRERGGLVCAACVAERYPHWQRYTEASATAAKHGRRRRAPRRRNEAGGPAAARLATVS